MCNGLDEVSIPRASYGGGNSVVRFRGVKVDLYTFRTDDAAIRLYTKWVNNENISMWTGQNREVFTYEQEAVTLTDAERYKKGKHFNIVRKDTGVLIGNCSVTVDERNPSNGRIGIMIGDEGNCNEGFGTETIKLLLKYCFEDLGLHNVTLGVHGDNARAIKCYTKCGFKEAGRYREFMWAKDHWADRVFMQILANEYYANKPNKLPTDNARPQYD